MISENTGSNGFTIVFDWTYDDDVLTFIGITFPDGSHADTFDTLPDDLPPDFDPFFYLVSTGSWKMEQVQPDTTILDVGMTPGWDSIVDPVLSAMANASSGNASTRNGTYIRAFLTSRRSVSRSPFQLGAGRDAMAPL